jgi:hypothetical protein
MRDLHGRHPESDESGVNPIMGDSRVRAHLENRQKTQVPLRSAPHRAVECPPSSPKTAHDLFGSTDRRFDQDAILCAIAASFATIGPPRTKLLHWDGK